MVMQCRPGMSWEPLDGDVLWLATGQTFQHWMDVAVPWPVGTTSWLEIDGIAGHFAEGVLSDDRLSFGYRLESDAAAIPLAADRAAYRFWVLVPNDETSTPDRWLWVVGEVRRKDG